MSEIIQFGLSGAVPECPDIRRDVSRGRPSTELRDPPLINSGASVDLLLKIKVQELLCSYVIG